MAQSPKRAAVLLIACMLTACSPAPQAPITPRLLNVFVTSAASPRTSELYACAPGSLVIAMSDPASAELTLRLGEPSPLNQLAFQVGSEDLLVVTHPQAGVGPLTLEQVQQLFSGRAANWKDVGGNDLSVQVWAFDAGEDIQQAFDRLVMHGEAVSSLARLAVSAQSMSDSVGNTPGSIGFLPGRWKAGNTRTALEAASLPVLVLARNQPEGAVRDLIGCLQAGR